MKIPCFAAIVLWFGFFACGKPATPSSPPPDVASASPLPANNAAPIGVGKRKAKDRNPTADSAYNAAILTEALDKAQTTKKQSPWSESFQTQLPDTGYLVEVSTQMDAFFSNDPHQLIIRRKSPADMYIDVFYKRKGKYQRVLTHQQWRMEYTGDTVRDINGDGLKDFVVEWYGSNGCCLKAFSVVYLQRADKQSFSQPFEFINPHFSPREGMIRGVCYGHPGETKMYKYQWRGKKIDTLEYIAYEKNNAGEKTGRLAVSNKESKYSKGYKILRIVDRVPLEYQRIPDYDWFRGNTN